MRQQTGQLGWAQGALRQLYLDADERGRHVWRIYRAYGKHPDEVEPDHCEPLPSFRAPGITVQNAFGNRTEALRVSEHYCRLASTRTEQRTWGCWRWENGDGGQVLQLCIPSPAGSATYGAQPPDSREDAGQRESIGMPRGLAQISEGILRHAELVRRECFGRPGTKLVERDFHLALANRLRREGIGVDPSFSVLVPGASPRQLDILVEDVLVVEVKAENWANTALKWRNYAQGYYYCLVAKKPFCLVINFERNGVGVLQVTPDDDVTMDPSGAMALKSLPRV